MRSKLVRLGLEGECVQLSASGMSYQEMAEKLSERAGEPISRFSVSRFIASRKASREECAAEPAHQLHMLNSAMLEDLEKLRAEGDLRTASSYYRVIHDNLQLREKLGAAAGGGGLCEPVVHDLVQLILEEVNDEQKKRITQRLAELSQG